MKFAVIGSRTFDDYELLCSVLNALDVSLIVSGGARGADSLAERWAIENNVQTLIFHPNWKLHGKRAGYLRNVEIVDSCDEVIAFWDGASKGTRHSIEYAEKTNKKVKIYDI